MIWYDVASLEPVAPGSCEDGGVPSIESYQCPNCGHDGLPVFNTIEVDYSVEPVLGIGQCESCGKVLLTAA